MKRWRSLHRNDVLDVAEADREGVTSAGRPEGETRGNLVWRPGYNRSARRLPRNPNATIAPCRKAMRCASLREQPAVTLGTDPVTYACSDSNRDALRHALKTACYQFHTRRPEIETFRMKYRRLTKSFRGAFRALRASSSRFLARLIVNESTNAGHLRHVIHGAVEHGSLCRGCVVRSAFDELQRRSTNFLVGRGGRSSPAS